MEAAFPDLLPTSDAAKFLGVPLKERWEHLKPVIVRLFIGPPVHGSKAATLPQLVRFMKEHYQFHAVESEYRTHFRSWGVVKRATEKRKKQAMKALIRRQVPAATVSDVHFKDESTQRQIDSKQWRRYMRDYLRNLHEPLSPGILTSFSLPFEAFVRSLSRFDISRLTGDPSTPYSDASTPEALTVWSPRDPTPAIAGSGQETRDMQLLNQRVKADRTCLFLRGDIIKLASQLELNDQRILVNHFHKFFQHAYSQAKHWDQYDHRSTQTANEVARQLPIPSDLHTMPELAINSPSENSILDSRKPIDQPTALCFWAVHVSPRAVWKEGGLAMTITQDQESKHFPDLLRHAVSTGDFPNSTSGDLPICTEVLVRSVERDPHAMTLDAWRLAIMAGNGDLLWNLFEKEGDKLPAGIDDLYPLHLAAAYLNGGHTCCMIISELWRMCPSGYAYHHDIDSNGLTILDAIFVAILRSHTLLEPNAASYAYQGRFPGEDQDICGRWNPESSAVQALQNAGKPRIPATWKHPFCHTSVQTVCHSILVIYGSPQPPRQNRHSGLFSRICTHCGMRLQLGPIHVVVLAAFFLAEKGRPGETLFGTLAVLVCMMRTGFDASEAVEVSVQDVLGSEGQGLCSHRLMTPAALMESIAYQKIASWSEDCRLGWHCMQAALAHSEVARQRSGDDYPSDSGSNSDFVVEEAITNAEPCILSELDYHDRSFPCADQKEGDLWAVIQAEMLTYRRRADGEAWLSHRFSMKALRDWLTGRTESLETPMVAEDLLQAHSRCGWYLGRHEGTQFPTAEDVSKRYFMNLDVYDRATFLDPQDIEQL